jgi:hypothetical protein
MKTLYACLLAGIAIAMTAGQPASAAAATDDASKAAKPSDARGDDCIFSNTIRDWTQLDSSTLIVWGMGRNQAYLVKLSMPLPNIGPLRLGFIDRDHNGMLCGYGLDQVFSPDPIFRQRSTVLSMKKLDIPALTGLEEQYKVKLLPKSPSPNKDQGKDKPDDAEKKAS